MPSLAAGDKLGPYEIVALIGAGGMGEVYRAHDTRLNRDVAVKVSTSQFTERFDREARAVAALNHPNICTLYDIGPNYLVMEYIEGEAPRGPLPIEEALRIARQIADALEAAHEKGITHRDLKPANIKLKPDGSVKVLDFGLAKTSPAREGGGEDSPTLSMAATQAGVILGTAAYMSPEQARGKPVDKRADIWAFGVVLYELITGKRLFQGEDLTDTLARVVRDQSDLSLAPPEVRRLLERCLEKDPKKRLRDIGDVWLLLDEAPTSVVTASQPRFRWLPWVVAGATSLVAILVAFLWFHAPVPETISAQFQIDPPADAHFTAAAMAISPDGRYVVFGASTQGKPPLWLRPLDSLAARPLQGTEGANFPFWSYDNKSIAYYEGGKLKRIDVIGGAPQTLCDAVQSADAGGTWNRDGTILFASTGGLFRLSSSGGVPKPVTEVDMARKELWHGRPQFLPDGNRFLYFIRSEDPKVQGIYAASLDKPEDRVPIVSTDLKASYVPTPDGRSGYLLWMRDRTLLAQPFDAAKLSLQGNPAPVAEDITAAGGIVRAAFWTSDAGVLAYRKSPANEGSNTLTWFDRQGKPSSIIGNPQAYGELALSPDGSRVAVSRQDSVGGDLWMIELARGSSTRLTTDSGNESCPVWSPDGKQIAYSSSRAGNNLFDLYKKPAGASGEEELLLKDEAVKRPSDWSRDGRFLLYSTQTKQTFLDLWVLPMGDGERKPVKYLATQFNESDARFSPDGRWVAYVSDVSKRAEVYVSPFPDAAASPAVLVSTEGGTLPRWRRDGKGLYYLAPGRNLMEVEITPGPSFKVGVPKLLFQAPVPGLNSACGWSWDVTSDGQRFLLNTPVEQQRVAPLTMLTNWQARLKK